VPEPVVRIDHVTKRFGEYSAVEDVTLDIARNELFALLGPSGCGKTTLLRMLAGFERPSAGRIVIDGEDMTAVPPNRRPVNMVFQSYAVFPHLSVVENVAYGLRVDGTPAGEIRPRVTGALEMVRLAGYADRMPDQLSGGQRQRVALARALVKRPKVLLLDEPLSALDRKLREDMQLELVRLQHEVGITFVMVTHDQDEALSMANRVAVMDAGRVLQVADPRTLYENPTHRLVADFIGTTNSLEVEVEAVDGDRARVRHRLLGELEVARAAPHVTGGVLIIRPEKLRLDLNSAPLEGERGLEAVIEQVAYYGDLSFVFARLDDGTRVQVSRYNVNRIDKGDPPPGTRCRVGFHTDDLLLVDDEA
jgi:spermidine/putrescine transport system ATP-binding protein/putrescine transport system ATP-binding protein